MCFGSLDELDPIITVYIGLTVRKSIYITKKVINWESNILVNKFPNWHCLLKKNKSRPLSFDTYKVRLSIYLKNGVDYRNGFTQQIKVFLFILSAFSKLCNMVRFITIWKLFRPTGYIFHYLFFYRIFLLWSKKIINYHRPRDMRYVLYAWHVTTTYI